MDNANRYDRLLAEKERLEEKIKTQEARLQLNRSSENNKLRKARTRLLIQKGALLEKYFDIEHLSVSDTEALLVHFADYVKSNIPDF